MDSGLLRSSRAGVEWGEILTGEQRPLGFYMYLTPDNIKTLQASGEYRIQEYKKEIDKLHTKIRKLQGDMLWAAEREE